MKHTSIRLTDEHAKKIEATGKKPSIVVREALDAYFGIPPDDSGPLQRLIEDHERRCHSAQPAHIASTEPRHIVPQPAHDIATLALNYILAELEAGREPLLPDVAAHVGKHPQTLSKALSPLDIRPQETKKGGKPGRYFTFDLKPAIEAMLSPQESP